jgi:hypothetical protein
MNFNKSQSSIPKSQSSISKSQSSIPKSQCSICQSKSKIMCHFCSHKFCNFHKKRNMKKVTLKNFKKFLGLKCFGGKKKNLCTKCYYTKLKNGELKKKKEVDIFIIRGKCPICRDKLDQFWRCPNCNKYVKSNHS